MGSPVPAMENDAIIRALTITSLAGLLTAVGMRLTMSQVLAALRGCNLALLTALNFAIVPLLILLATRLFAFEDEVVIGMVLLSAAPFAPVVPVFARMARADLPLAGGLSAVFPTLSIFLTPLVCELELKRLSLSDVPFNATEALLILAATIVCPLALGMILNRFVPAFARLVLRPAEILSEAAGAISLAFVSVTAWSAIVSVGWRPLLVMGGASELSFLLGYGMGGVSRDSRLVTGLGTSNRNIALALLLALQCFPGQQVAASVVANGLVLIALGLIHVGLWRLWDQRASE